MTHKGRDSSSGHYIAFVRKEGKGGSSDVAGGNDKTAPWLVFDDDTVEETNAEVVGSRLKGGGDDLCVLLQCV